MNHSFCVGRERRNSIPSGPDVGQAPIPEESSSVFLLAAPFRCSDAGFFTPALRRKSSRPLIYIETNCLYQ